MKFKIKYSETRKFVLSVEENDPTMGDLKCKILKFISDAYHLNLDNISISLNGKDPLTGDESITLSSIGIVHGDTLYIISQKNIGASTINTPLRDRAGPSNVKRDKTDRRSGVQQKQTIPLEPKQPMTLLNVTEGLIPASVTRIFESYTPTKPSEAMTLLFHVAMYECGFRIAGDTSNVMTNLPKGWRLPVSIINYFHPGFNNFECTLTLVTMGDTMQVLASFTGQESEISIKLSINDYVPTNQVLPHRLKKLLPLSLTMGNSLLYPLRVAAHELLGIAAPWHLAGLPVDTLYYMCSYLDVSSIIRLSATCLRLYTAFKENRFWYDVYRRDFGSKSKTSKNIMDIDWKIEYMKEYKRKKESDKRRKRDPDIYPVPIPPLPFRPDSNPYPHFPHHPNPFNDPDSPYFGGDVPFYPGNPLNPNPSPRGPLGPFGDLPSGPMGPQYPYMHPKPPKPRGPRFDFW